MWIHCAAHLQSKPVFPSALAQHQGKEMCQKHGASSLCLFKGTSDLKSQRLFPLNIPLPSSAQHLSRVVSQSILQQSSWVSFRGDTKDVWKHLPGFHRSAPEVSTCTKETILLTSISSTYFLEKNFTCYWYCIERRVRGSVHMAKLRCCFF